MVTTIREFLRGWRRKIGCLALALACLLVVGWLRSRFYYDCVLFDFVNRKHHVVSMNNTIVWGAFDIGSMMFSFTCWCKPVGEGLPEDVEFAKVRSWFYFELNDGIPGAVWTIPYWSIVIPMTSIAAILILWPGKRDRTQANNSEANAKQSIHNQIACS